MVSFDYFGQTDVGLVRLNNEDVFSFDPDKNYGLVADGMGGAAAGEIASQIFAEAVSQVFSNSSDESEKSVVDRVQQSFKIANANILKHQEKSPEHRGMGCTAELLALFSEGFVLGHMGDSRTYRFRKGELVQLTKDHSLVQEQLDQGLISEEDAKKHSMRNVILRAVGVRESLALDILRGKIRKGDFFLLCSDGLTDMINDHNIKKILSEPGGVKIKVEKLVDLAKQAGGRDNITVVLVKVVE